MLCSAFPSLQSTLNWMAPGSVHCILRMPFWNILLCQALPAAKHMASLGLQLLLCQARCWSPVMHLVLTSMLFYYNRCLQQCRSKSTLFFFFSFSPQLLSTLIPNKTINLCAIAFWLSHAHFPFVIFASKSSRVFNRFLISYSVANKEARFLAILIANAFNCGLFYLTTWMKVV